MLPSTCLRFGVVPARRAGSNRSWVLITVMLLLSAFAVARCEVSSSVQQCWYRKSVTQVNWPAGWMCHAEMGLCQNGTVGCHGRAEVATVWRQSKELFRISTLTATPARTAQIPPPVVHSSAIRALGKAVIPPLALPANPGYRPPTSRPIQEPFREPTGTYGAGNRGIDYAVLEGDEVRSIGAGTVVFAGRVAGEKYITVLHPDGLRSSYSYLASISVIVGTVIRRGEELGRSSDRFQVGVRDGERYIDPQLLFDRVAGFAVLVRLRYGISPVRQLRRPFEDPYSRSPLFPRCGASPVAVLRGASSQPTEGKCGSP